MVARDGAQPTRGTSMMVSTWLFVMVGQYSKNLALGSRLGYSYPRAQMDICQGGLCSVVIDKVYAMRTRPAMRKLALRTRRYCRRSQTPMNLHKEKFQEGCNKTNS